MHTAITYILLSLEGRGEVSRKQIKDWIGKSLSYIDLRFRGEKDWAGEDVDKIIQKGFELEIPEFVNRYTKEKVLMDLEYMSDMIDGDILQELKALQKTMGEVIESWDNEHKGTPCIEICKKGIRLFATIQKEFEERKL